MITCKQCETSKPGSSFYASNRTTCKDCVRANVRENRQSKIEYYRAYDRKRGNRQAKDYLPGYRESNAAKYKAHCMVNNALRDKRMFRGSCEECGSEMVHAHHDDYLKPLDVRWLCPAHHRQWHIANGEAANADATEDEFWQAVAQAKASSN